MPCSLSLALDLAALQEQSRTQGRAPDSGAPANRVQETKCRVRFTLTMLHTIQTNELRSCGSKLVEKTSSKCPEHCPKLSAPLPHNILFLPSVAESVAGRLREYSISWLVYSP